MNPVFGVTNGFYKLYLNNEVPIKLKQKLGIPNFLSVQFANFSISFGTVSKNYS